jgi:5-methylcytosine-specific restriction protein A
VGRPTVQAFTDKTKKTIVERQKGRCLMCGLVCRTGQFHHRKPRRMGGGIDLRVGQAANGVLLHPSCHHRIESHREWAIKRGWILAAAEWPEEVPVKAWHGWVRLVGDGMVEVEAA